jgi:hypothetical protein
LAYPEALQWVEFRKVAEFPSRSELCGLLTRAGHKTFMKRKKANVKGVMDRLGPVKLLNYRENLIAQLEDARRGRSPAVTKAV